MVRGPDNFSTNSAGTSSVGSGESIRIKIRKNSIEPHSKVKAAVAAAQL